MSTLTFEEAREAARAALAPGPTRGTFYVSTAGYEDASMYLISAGAREGIVGGDPDYWDMTGLATFVSKVDGRVYRLPTIDNLDRIAKMTPCGTPEPD